MDPPKRHVYGRPPSSPKEACQVWTDLKKQTSSFRLPNAADRKAGPLPVTPRRHSGLRPRAGRPGGPRVVAAQPTGRQRGRQRPHLAAEPRRHSQRPPGACRRSSMALGRRTRTMHASGLAAAASLLTGKLTPGAQAEAGSPPRPGSARAPLRLSGPRPRVSRRRRCRMAPRVGPPARRKRVRTSRLRNLKTRAGFECH
jgi:hypothetical protein